jgi:hypothetical protein
MTAFESSLERDFLLLLDFDPDVEFFEEQPVKIVYHDASRRRRTYTPDVLVRYRTDPPPARHTKPLLCEVKYRDDLRQHWTDYRPKFRAAGRYAQQRGWRFRLVTERHVRTPYLDNVKSLLLDSGVVALTMSYDPIFVIISSSKPLSFNDLKNDLGLSNNIEA